MSDGHDEARDGASGLSLREFGTGIVGLGVVLGLDRRKISLTRNLLEWRRNEFPSQRQDSKSRFGGSKKAQKIPALCSNRPCSIRPQQGRFGEVAGLTGAKIDEKRNRG